MATISCDEGYTLSGAANEICAEEGNMSDPVRECLEDCAALTALVMGKHRQTLLQPKEPWQLYHVMKDLTFNRAANAKEGNRSDPV